MHPQTLRQYDRLGLVTPSRASGRGRRYSLRDIATLREVQRLSQDEGVNLAGIKRILELEAELERLRRQVEYLRAFVDPGRRIFTADPRGDVVAVNRTAQPQPPPDDHGRPRRGRPLAPEQPLTRRNVRTRRTSAQSDVPTPSATSASDGCDPPVRTSAALDCADVRTFGRPDARMCGRPATGAA